MTDSNSHTHNWIWSDGENGRRSFCLDCPETRDGWVTGSSDMTDTEQIPPAPTTLNAKGIRHLLTRAGFTSALNMASRGQGGYSVPGSSQESATVVVRWRRSDMMTDEQADACRSDMLNQYAVALRQRGYHCVVAEQYVTVSRAPRRSITVTYLDGTTEDIPEIPDEEIAAAIWTEIVMHERVREAILYRADGTEASRYRLAVSGGGACGECGCWPGHQRSCSQGRERAVPRIPGPRTEPCGTTCQDGSVAPWTELQPVICGHVSRVFGKVCRRVAGHDTDHRSTPLLSDRSYAWDDTH